MTGGESHQSIQPKQAGLLSNISDGDTIQYLIDFCHHQD